MDPPTCSHGPPAIHRAPHRLIGCPAFIARVHPRGAQHLALLCFHHHYIPFWSSRAPGCLRHIRTPLVPRWLPRYKRIHYRGEHYNIFTSFIMFHQFFILVVVLKGAFCVQPEAPPPKAAPLRDLPWAQLNFLHTTDIHGWWGGHLQEYVISS